MTAIAMNGEAELGAQSIVDKDCRSQFDLVAY